MYEVFLKSWYPEVHTGIQRGGIQEEVMYSADNIEEAFDFLKNNADHYIEWYPLEEIGVRIKK